MVRIRAAVPILPVPLIAAGLVRAGGVAATPDLEARVAELVDEARAKGANLHLSEGSVEGSVRFATGALARHGIVTLDGGAVRIARGQEAMLGYYAASALQRLAEPGEEPVTPTASLTLPEVAET
jgi:hypothetical protein